MGTGGGGERRPRSQPWLRRTGSSWTSHPSRSTYFLWSAQENLEWGDGFGTRFGLIYVDFDTLERIPKLSAEWFREAARQNAVV